MLKFEFPEVNKISFEAREAVALTIDLPDPDVDWVENPSSDII